jgi:hypothetical protein
MTTKEVAIQTIENLPDDATWDDVLERINFVAGVRKGLLELDAGKAIPHDQFRRSTLDGLPTKIEIARVWHAARGKVDIQTALDRMRDQTDPAVSSHALRKSLGL